MNTLLLLPILVLSLISFAYVDTTVSISGVTYAQESSTEIPVWVKGVANFWIEGNISDDEFGEAVTFLIEQGIFKIDSVVVPQQNPLADEEKRLFELELNQKDDRITILENEVRDVGLDNAHLLNSIVEKESSVNTLQKLLDQVRNDFQKYKEDYPLKVGNIGGVQVSVDTIRQQEQKIQELYQVIQELEDEIRELKN